MELATVADVEPVSVPAVPGIETDPHEHLKLYEQLSKQINNNYAVLRVLTKQAQTTPPVTA